MVTPEGRGSSRKGAVGWAAGVGGLTSLAGGDPEVCRSQDQEGQSLGPAREDLGRRRWVPTPPSRCFAHLRPQLGPAHPIRQFQGPAQPPGFGFSPLTLIP